MEQDNQEAAYWWSQAAEQGVVDAQARLGYMYEEGLGVGQDYGQAAKWYERAAAQGDAGAQNNLANLYEQGLGVTQDYERGGLALWPGSEPECRGCREQSRQPLRAGLGRAQGLCGGCRVVAPSGPPG